jgi:hypothetical protein
MAHLFVILLFYGFATLEQTAPTDREGQVVFVRQKYFWRTKTQLAMFTGIWNLTLVD